MWGTAVILAVGGAQFWCCLLAKFEAGSFENQCVLKLPVKPEVERSEREQPFVETTDDAAFLILP